MLEVKVDQGWAWVVLAAVFGTHFISGSLQYTVGIIRLNLMQNALAEDTAFITWIVSLFISLITFTGLYCSVLVRYLGCRKSVLIGATLQTVGFIGSYLVTETRMLLLTFSILAGTGSGICYSTAMIVISYHFDRYLGLASGIAVSAQGLGTMLVNLIDITVNYYGLRNFFLLVAGYTAQNFVFGSLLRPSQYEQKGAKQIENIEMVKGKDNSIYEPDDLDKGKNCKEDSDKPLVYQTQYASENYPKINDSSQDKNDIEKDQLSADKNGENIHSNIQLNTQYLVNRKNSVKEQSNIKISIEIETDKANKIPDSNENENWWQEYIILLKNYRMILLMLFTLFFASAESIFYILLPTYFMERGSNKAEVGQMFSIVGIASTTSRFLTGVIVNKDTVPLPVLLSGPSFIISLCSFAATFFIDLHWVQFAYCIAYGLMDFTVYSLINKVCVKIAGVRRSATAISLMLSNWGIGGLIGSPIAETIASWTGSSKALTLVIGTFYLIGSLLAIPVAL
ncbi:uncharacterized protein LOC115219065 isoform X1 [Argonauta hians]